jgi:hypothetical protein
MFDVIVHAEAVLAKFGRASSNMPRTNQDAMKDAIHYAQSRIPHSPPGQTGTLQAVIHAGPGGGSIGRATSLTRVEPFGKDVRGVIGASSDYIHYVIDEHRQARVHRGRWWILQKRIRDARDGITQIYREGVLRLFR